jgi:hypothetical protein
MGVRARQSTWSDKSAGGEDYDAYRTNQALEFT